MGPSRRQRRRRAAILCGASPGRDGGGESRRRARAVCAGAVRAALCGFPAGGTAALGSPVGVGGVLMRQGAA